MHYLFFKLDLTNAGPNYADGPFFPQAVGSESDVANWVHEHEPQASNDDRKVFVQLPALDGSLVDVVPASANMALSFLENRLPLFAEEGGDVRGWMLIPSYDYVRKTANSAPQNGTSNLFTH